MAEDYRADHPDWKQDEDETVSLIERQLTPVFEMIGKMFEAADERMNRIEELVGNIVDGFGEAVDSHKRGSLKERLDPFHADLEQLSGIYSDFHEGKDYSEDLIDELMKSGDEITDDTIRGKIDEHKKRWGKYIGMEMPEEEEAGEEEAGEGPEEEGVEIPMAEGGADQLTGGKDIFPGGQGGAAAALLLRAKGQLKNKPPLLGQSGTRYEKGTDSAEGMEKEGSKEKKSKKGEDKRETLKYPTDATSERLRKAMNGG